MTRKDYVLLAGFLNDKRKDLEASMMPQAEATLKGFDEAVKAIVKALKSENYRFDAEKFADAVTK
jgi:hypothetical protein